ncbi:MAG: signal protein [Gammaproteobacteria bacterium SG8_15]|nr:MAG: signal protein [Gammaproteobacteria bacterium SG8_15]
MGLLAKFNLVMLLVFVLGITGAGFVSYDVLQRNAREEVLHTASIIMEGAMAARNYTIEEIKPLLTADLRKEFLPQTVPAYAAMRNVHGLREKYPEYTYKEATLNPTNPASRATEWETGIIEHFRNNNGAEQLIGEHETAAGPMLYIAKPIQIKTQDCLLCHGKIEDAPTTMIERYGDANGFGWKLDEVVGSQLVNVPMSVPLTRAEKTFTTFMVSLGAVLLVSFIILNVLLQRIVIKPVRKMSSIAHDVSMGKMDVPECDAHGKDEIGTLAESFNRMRRSLVNAMQMLDD